MPEQEPDPRWELVFDEALRALTFQQSTLDNLRSRATLLTAGAALVSSALGAPSLQGANRFGIAALVAILALGGVLAAAAIICAPWWRWRFVEALPVAVAAWVLVAVAAWVLVAVARPACHLVLVVGTVPARTSTSGTSGWWSTCTATIAPCPCR